MKLQLCGNFLQNRALLRQTLLFMRMLIVFMTITCLQVSATGFSQKINLNGRFNSMEKVFSSLKQQTGYNFWYDYDLLKNTGPFNVRAKDASLETVLRELLDDRGLTFTIEDKIVVIRRKEDAGNKDLPVPPREIKGHVYNDMGDPLSGAVILLKGTKKAAVTNERGEFTMQLSAEEAVGGTLVFTYVGYHKKEYRVSGHSSIDITLEKNVQELSAFVVTNGYSKPKRKEEVVGSVATVSAQQLQTTRPIESFDKMLEGLVPGMQVVTNTELGTPVKINIRGQNSLSGLNGANTTDLTTSSQPLFVVDGVPITEQRKKDEPYAFISSEELLNAMAGINPDDIESISVLKDAAAAAIYGANASNGVIIITTKKGRAGRARLNLNYSNGWSQSINRLKWLSGPEYHQLLKETYLNDGRTEFDADQLAGSPDINTNWFELLNRFGTFRNLDIDLSGGTESTQFRISGSYLDQQSIQKGNDFQKLYIRMRIDHRINKKLGFSMSLAPSITNKTAQNAYAIVPIAPNIPVYNADGSFYKLSSLGVPNPLAVLAQNRNKHSGGTMNGVFRMEYEPLKNFRLSSSFGVDGLMNKLDLFKSPKNATGENLNGFAEIYDRTDFSWISSSQVNWSGKLAARHKLDVTAGFEARGEQTKLLRGSGSGFTYSGITELSVAQNRQSASSRQTASTVSGYGQAIYNFSEKYFLSLSGRYDASSIFGTDVNATVNSAAGLGWLINRENFLREQNWIDMLRLRVSYGTTGNSRIGSYQARGIYTFSSTGYNDQTSSYISTAPNPDLGWEKGYKTNIGLDFSFLKRFNITADVYNNITDDAISTITTPIENGFSSVLANVAKMRNRGFDAGITAQIFTGDFRWTSTLNVGYNENKVLEVKNDYTRYASQTYLAALLKSSVSTTAIWGFEFAGVDPATGREMYYDNTGKIVNAADLDRNLQNAYYLGDRLPKAQGGFINAFGYKGISLTVNILYSFGAKTLIDYINENNGRNLPERNMSVNLLDRWQKPGDITNIPKLSTGVSGQGNPIVSNSSKYVYDDTFIKLSNVGISYQLPKKVTEKLKGVSVTVYGNGTNLLYWYKQDSPRGRNGVREYKYSFPEAQSFTWGVRLGL